MQDLRDALRSLSRERGFSALVIVVLALAIGANTAIFTVVDAVLLRALPYRAPDEIVHVSERGAEGREMNFSYPDFLDFRAATRTLATTALYKDDTVVLGDGAEPRQIAVGVVTADFFAVLGAEPRLGRAFTADEDRPGGPAAVVLSDELWRAAYGADPAIVGRVARLDTAPYTVVGVVPPGLALPRGVGAWISLGRGSRGMGRTGHSAGRMVARLAPGATLAAARAELDAIGRDIDARLDPDIALTGAAVTPLHRELTGPVRPALLMLLAAVGLVLLIGCANVANLLLVRATRRRRELAVRAALGATRGRLLRQLLVESLLLAGIAGLLGAWLATWGTELLLAVGPADLRAGGEVALSWRVLAFALAVSVATGVGFGLWPALRASGVDPADDLRDGGHGAVRGFTRSRKLLVAAEVALATVLLVGASLLADSFRRVTRVAPGFDLDAVFTAQTSLPGARYRERADVRRFALELDARLAEIPGVDAAAVVDIPPLSSSYNQMGTEIAGMPAPEEWPGIDTAAVSPGYFRTLGIPILAGRAFDAGDGEGGAPVVIVDAELLRRYPAATVGGRLRMTGDGRPWLTIVGVAGNVKHTGLDRGAQPQLYLPLAQQPAWSLSVVVRAPLPPATLERAVAGAVRAVDPGQPIFGAATMRAVAADTLAGRRFTTLVLAVFALTALALAALGIYGVVAFSTSLRAHELAVRVALGARARDVARLVIAEGMAPVVAGIAAGALASLAGARVITSLVYGAPRLELSYALGAGVLLLVALAAIWFPARRATRVEPMAVLRSE